jgi:hypothetical protein
MECFLLLVNYNEYLTMIGDRKMTLQFEQSNNHTKTAKHSVQILVLTFISGLLLTQISQAETLIGGDSEWALFGGVMSEYSEFGDEDQALLAVGQVGVQLTNPNQGLAFALYGKSSISQFTPIGGTYYAAGGTVEYLYQPNMAGFFSGGASLGLSTTYQEVTNTETAAADPAAEADPAADATTSATEAEMEFGDIALHSEVFGRYRISVNDWLQAGIHAGYRLAPDHSPTGQKMTGVNAAVFFNFGNF